MVGRWCRKRGAWIPSVAWLDLTGIVSSDKIETAWIGRRDGK